MDFTYREHKNVLLEVEWMGGDSEMMEEEYKQGRYTPEELSPKTGEMRFKPHLGGAAYTCAVLFRPWLL
jgi:hypothetical protein